MPRNPSIETPIPFQFSQSGQSSAHDRDLFIYDCIFLTFFFRLQGHGGHCNYSSGSSKRPDSPAGSDDFNGRESPGGSGPLSPGAESMDSDSSISLMGPPSPVSSSSHNAETRSTSPDATATATGATATAAAAAAASAAASAASAAAKSIGNSSLVFN